MNLDAFYRLFEAFASSAFRLETLQAYAIPEEAGLVADFLAGKPLPDWTPENNEFMAQLAADTAAGKRWQRVHVIDLPLTDYLRYELAAYRCGAAAGEDIRILDRAEHAAFADVREDFWAFDLDDPTRAAVAVMRYDPDGRFLGVDRGEDLDRYRRLRDLAWAHAIPLGDYSAQERRYSA